MAIIYTWSMNPDEVRRMVSNTSAAYSAVHAFKNLGLCDSDVVKKLVDLYGADYEYALNCVEQYYVDLKNHTLPWQFD